MTQPVQGRPIEAELPDGTILEFPAGTPDDIIQSTVKRELGIEQPRQVPAEGNTSPSGQPPKRLAGNPFAPRQAAGSRYEVTSPDGGGSEITAPAGASETEVLAYAQQNVGPASSSPNAPSLAPAGVRSVVGDLQSLFDGGADRETLIAAAPAGLNEADLDRAITHRDRGGKGTRFVPNEPAPPPAPALQPPVPLAGLASLFNGDDGSSAAGSFGRGAIRGAAPAAAGMAAFGPGFTVGATVGAAGGPAAPVTVPVGGVIGGLISSLAAAYAANEAQEFALDHVPEVERFLGQDNAQRSADVGQHPWANFGGQLATSLPFLRPGIPGRVPIGEGASTLERALASPVTAPAIGATASGAGEAARQLSSDEPADMVKVGMALAAGALLNKPTTLVFGR